MIGSATDTQHPAGRRTLSGGGALRLLASVRGLIGIALLILVPLTNGGQTLISAATFACLYGLIALAIVVLNGYAGQFSLAYAVVAGVGAYVSAYSTLHGTSSLLAILFGALAAAVLGLIISAPARRIRGLQLAVVTLAAAQAGAAVFIRVSGFDGRTVAPPKIGGYLFFSVQSDLWLAGIAFAVVFVGVRIFLHSAGGKRLLLVRTDARTARSLGINTSVANTKAFVISSFIAGIGGAIYPMMLLYIGPDAYGFQFLTLLFVVILVGGLTSAEGAVWGAIFYVILTRAIGTTSDTAQALFGGLMLVAVIVRAGLSEGAGPLDPVVGWLTTRWRRLGPARLGRIGVVGPARFDRVPAKVRGEVADRLRHRGQVVLSATGVNKSYGGLNVLQDASIEVRAGQIVALIGPNGAGKTTLVSILAGQLRADSGTVVFDAEPVLVNHEHRFARHGLGRAFQHPQLVPELTVWENLVLSLTRRDSTLERGAAHDLLDRLGLVELLDAKVADLPFGLLKLVDLARVGLRLPKVLLLDEPAAGLSGVEQARLTEYLDAVCAEGTAVLIIEHRMDIVREHASYVYVLDSGRTIATGTPDEVLSHADVVDAYLGQSAALGTGRAELPREEAMTGRSGARPADPAPRTASGGEPLLAVDGLVCGYRRGWSVLHDIELTVERSQIVAVLGANGAGKSTLLRAILGMISVGSGSIRFDGEQVAGLRAARRVGKGFALVPEGGGILRGLSVRENLDAGAFPRRRELRGRALDDLRAEVLEIFPELARRQNQEAGSLSGGERAMLAVSRALMGKPSLLLLDEPSLGLSPVARLRLFDALVAARTQRGLTVLVAEQDVTNALRVADQVYALRGGRVVASGPTEHFRDDPVLREVYLAQGTADIEQREG